MKQNQKPEKSRNNHALHVIMGGALLFLAVILAKSAVTQLGSGQTVTGVVSLIGTLLFAAVGIMMLRDLIKGLRHPAGETAEEDPEEDL